MELWTLDQVAAHWGVNAAQANELLERKNINRHEGRYPRHRVLEVDPPRRVGAAVYAERINILDVLFNRPAVRHIRPGPVMREGLRAAGVPRALVRDFVEITYDIVEFESGWDHGAASRRYSNGDVQLAADGEHPDAERGLSKLAPGVFARYHAHGTSRNIYDPVASVAALWLGISDRFDVNLQNGDVLQVFIDMWCTYPESWWDRPLNQSAETFDVEIVDSAPLRIPSASDLWNDMIYRIRRG